MGLFENMPYTNFHEMNLDWILSKVKHLEDLIAVNEKTALDIAQDVATNYEKASNITSTRKLSASGDFSGTIGGRSISAIFGDITDALTLVENLIELVNSGSGMNQIIDGGIVENGISDTNYYDGGMIDNE